MSYLSESEAIKIGEFVSYMESSTFLLYLDFRKFEDSLSEYKDKEQIISSSALRIPQILGHFKFVRSEGDISILVQTKDILYLYNNYPLSSTIKDLTLCITEQNLYKTIMNRFKTIRKKKTCYIGDILKPGFFGGYEDLTRVYASSSTIVKLSSSSIAATSTNNSSAELQYNPCNYINGSIPFIRLLNLCGFENFYVEIYVDSNIVKPVVKLNYTSKCIDDINVGFEIYLEANLISPLINFKSMFMIYSNVNLESAIKFSKNSIDGEASVKEYMNSLIPELKNACKTLQEFDDKIKFIETCNKFGISIK